MSVTRRGFVRTVGLGTVGMFSTSFIIGRGSEAAAFEPDAPPARPDDGIIRISSNENGRGPGQSAIQAIHDAMTPRMGRGYPPDGVNELRETIARKHGVAVSNVVVGTGSAPILEGAVHAFCSPERGVVSVAPTYLTCENTARRLGFPVNAVRVDDSLALDLDAMVEAADGMGLVFFCNPNNPTGTAHSLEDVEAYVRTVKERSPETAILIDEAYLEYVHDPAVRTAVRITQEYPGVFVTRSLSKAHGMAGLRVGYAVGQEDTVSRIPAAWHLGSMNTLSASAASASIEDTAHIEAEVAENARIRDMVMSTFREWGYDGPDVHTNCVFVNLGRPASWFRDECLARGVRVGRDFPPFEDRYSRITLGTAEEMEQAMEVFKEVLNA